MRALISVVVAATLFAVGVPAQAQSQQATGDSMKVLVAKVKADRKLLVSDNMKLSNEQAKAFWPIYEAYQKDLDALNTRLLKLIKEYAVAFNADKVNDETAKKLMNEMLSIESAEVTMRKNYAGKLSKAVSPVAAARYLQLENKLRALMRYELADQIPLVP